MSQHPLTPQQQQAFAAVQAFLAGDDDCFVLQGSAGTGKSTLISTIVAHLKELNKEIKLMAPTGLGDLAIEQRLIPRVIIHHQIPLPIL